MTKRHGGIWGLQLKVIAFTPDVDFLRLPTRDDAMHRVVKLKEPSLVKLHQRDRCNRLCHRIDSEDGVIAHGLAALDVHLPKCRRVPKITVPSNSHLTACNLLRLNVIALEKFSDAIQSTRIKSCEFWGIFHGPVLQPIELAPYHERLA